MNYTETLNLALSIVQQGLTLYNWITTTAKQSKEMSHEDYLEWIAKRDAMFRQPWHTIEPDPDINPEASEDP